MGAAFSNCRGDPMILRALPALHKPENKKYDQAQPLKIISVSIKLKHSNMW